MYVVEWPCCHDPLSLRLGFDDLLPRATTPLPRQTAKRRFASLAATLPLNRRSSPPRAHASQRALGDARGGLCVSSLQCVLRWGLFFSLRASRVSCLILVLPSPLCHCRPAAYAQRTCCPAGGAAPACPLHGCLVNQSLVLWILFPCPPSDACMQSCPVRTNMPRSSHP